MLIRGVIGPVLFRLPVAYRSAVAAAPDIREELTAPIKARIQNGTYGVDNASFVEKLLQKQEEMR